MEFDDFFVYATLETFFHQFFSKIQLKIVRAHDGSHNHNGYLKSFSPDSLFWQCFHHILIYSENFQLLLLLTDSYLLWVLDGELSSSDFYVMHDKAYTGMTYFEETITVPFI